MWNRKESPHARIPVSHPPCTPPPPHSPPLLRPRLFILGRVHSCVGCSHRTPPPRPRDPIIFRPRGGSGCMQPGPRIAGPVWNCADREALDPTELSWSTPLARRAAPPSRPRARAGRAAAGRKCAARAQRRRAEPDVGSARPFAQAPGRVPYKCAGQCDTQPSALKLLRRPSRCERRGRCSCRAARTRGPPRLRVGRVRLAGRCGQCAVQCAALPCLSTAPEPTPPARRRWRARATIRWAPRAPSRRRWGELPDRTRCARCCPSSATRLSLCPPLPPACPSAPPVRLLPTDSD